MPSTCKKKHWSLTRTCFHFLPYGFCMSDWLVHGSDCWAVATYCQPWVTGSHVFQFRVSDWLAHGSGWSWSIAKRCRPLVIGFGIPPANHLGGTLLPKRMFWFYDREGPPPRKNMLAFWPGGVPPPPGAQSFLWVSIWSLVRIRFNCVFMGFVLMGFNLATIGH